MAIALRCQRRECRFKISASIGPKPRSTGPRGPRCLLLSRFSSGGRASALQAEGPRFDPWNRDENSFPIRLGESTPLTRRPKGKRLVPVSGICGHGVQVSGSSPDDGLRVKLERYHGGLIHRVHGFKSHTRDFNAPWHNFGSAPDCRLPRARETRAFLFLAAAEGSIHSGYTLPSWRNGSAADL